MPESKEFTGTPWDANPSDEWNRTEYWQNYYTELTSKHLSVSTHLNNIFNRILRFLGSWHSHTESDTAWRLDLVVHRDLRSIAETPLSNDRPAVLDLIPTGGAILDAGCGISLIPRILAYWGYHVTAVDLCREALAFAESYPHDEVEMAKCIKIWEREERWATCVEDPVRSLNQLRLRRGDAGSVRYLHCDWFNPVLQPRSFDMILCRNSLRCSTMSYWESSISRFAELLKPDGLLYVECVNAVGIQEEANKLIDDAGFRRYSDEKSISFPRSGQAAISWWPTG